MYLPELAQELAEEDEPLSLAMADRILIARLSLDDAPLTSWDYMIGAWVRARREARDLARLARAPPPWLARARDALGQVDALLVSYAGLVLEMPDMFPRHEKQGVALSAAALVPTLLQLAADADDDEPPPSAHEWAAVPPAFAREFVHAFVERFSGDGALEGMLAPALHCLSQRLARAAPRTLPSAPVPTMTGGAPPDAPDTRDAPPDVHAVLAQMLGVADPRAPARRAAPAEGVSLTTLEWQPVLRAWEALMAVPGVAAAVPSFALFAPPSSAPALEHDMLLGPPLRLSTLPDAWPSIARQLAGTGLHASAELEAAMQSLRLAWNVAQNSHFQVWNALVRAGAAPRERVLALWGHLCQLNARRGAMQVRAHDVATDAFMVNVYDVLLRFAEPFAEPSCSKMDRIDAGYAQRQTRWDATSLTRVLASEAEAAAWMRDAPALARPNFVTDVFFLTQRLTNLALGKAIRTVEEKEKDIERLRKRRDELGAERAAWQATPQARGFEQITQRLDAQLDALQSEVLAAHTVLLEPGLVQRVLGFVSFSMAWVVRLVDPRHAHPHTPLTLPLPADAPELFRMLPEHVMEDLCDVVLFYTRHQPSVLDVAAKDSIATFCTVFLASGTYLRNPFLRAKLAETLSYNVMPYGMHPHGALSDTLNSQPLALAHLVPALMAFWIDAEATGSHTQFYDKFNIRYHLAQIFKAIWDSYDHQQRLHAEAAAHPSEFVVFINRMMNDVTFLLDDALDKLTELHVKQVERDDTAAWDARPAEERHEMEGIMRTIEGQIRSDLGLGHEFLRLMIMFTKETSASFVSPEIVDRLAAMLDYTLDVLVGPRCQELKVKDPKRVGFHPKTLLKEILQVFLHLAPHQAFVEAMARDGRSYRPEIFSKAASIAQRHMLCSPAEIDVLADLVGRVEAAKQQGQEEEEDWGDVPDEFLDPLLATLMRDPVKLPSSRAVVDRATIKAHLLSDGKDPFNRMPLQLADVQPDDELREKIEAWIAERRAARSSAP